MGESFWKDGALAGVDSILVPCRVAELWGDKYLECAAGEVESLCAAGVDVLWVLGAVVECDAGHGHVDVGEAEGGEGRLVAELEEAAWGPRLDIGRCEVDYKVWRGERVCADLGEGEGLEVGEGNGGEGGED